MFTLPHQLAPLALQNKEVIYGLLFRCSAQTFDQKLPRTRSISRPRSASSASSTPGIRSCSIIPTFTVLVPLPCVCLAITRTGCAPEMTGFFLPVGVLEAKSSAASFSEALQQAHASGQLQLHGLLRGLAQPRLFRSLIRQLSMRAALGGLLQTAFRWTPEQVLRYLGAYTHRVAGFPTTVSFPLLRTR